MSLQAALDVVHCVCYNVQREDVLVALLELLQQRGAELDSLVAPILYRRTTPAPAVSVGPDTPLHIVCRRRLERAASFLVRAGVDVTVANWVSYQPLSLFHSCFYLAVVFQQCFGLLL